MSDTTSSSKTSPAKSTHTQTTAPQVPTPPSDLPAQVRAALLEDVGEGDLCAPLIPANQTAKARLISRERAILCGQPWVDAVFATVDPTVSLHWSVPEGAEIAKDQCLLIIEGNARSLLTAERTALNFLQTLSGTATTVAEWVGYLSLSKTQLLDTRKTLPGLRTAQKYAVSVGGGVNHRMGLYDQFLIKENHIMAAGSITAVIAAAKAQSRHKTIEIEVESLAELEEAIQAGADIIMLDNFTLEDIEQAVKLTQGRAKLEVSGNVSPAELLTYAATGVDFISAGALTKHLRAIDFSLRFEK